MDRIHRSMRGTAGMKHPMEDIQEEDRIPYICPRCKQETGDPHPEDGLCPLCEVEWVEEYKDNPAVWGL